MKYEPFRSCHNKERLLKFKCEMMKFLDTCNLENIIRDKDSVKYGLCISLYRNERIEEIERDIFNNLSTCNLALLLWKRGLI